MEDPAVFAGLLSGLLPHHPSLLDLFSLHERDLGLELPAVDAWQGAVEEEVGDRDGQNLAPTITKPAPTKVNCKLDFEAQRGDDCLEESAQDLIIAPIGRDE